MMMMTTTMRMMRMLKMLMITMMSMMTVTTAVLVRLLLHAPRSRKICDKLDKYWHCFEGNLRETAERRGRSAYANFRALR